MRPERYSPEVECYFYRELEYEPITGIFRWIHSHARVKEGDIAGSLGVKGYWVISAFSRLYRAHRVAWFMTHGQWPLAQIDHVNGDRLDNRLCNIRLATNRLNNMNRSCHRQGKSCGVEYRHGHWRARAWVNGRNITVGLFNTENEAKMAYRKWVKENDSMTSGFLTASPSAEGGE